MDAKITIRKDPTKPYIGLEHIPSRGAYLTDWALASTSISTNTIFRAGDVLFGKLRPNLRKCIVAPFDGYCSTDILVLRPNEGVDPSFAGKVLRTEQVGIVAEMTSAGTKMPRTSWKHLSELEVFCPGLHEQARIAQILDTLDTAIHQTEAIIAKLEAVKEGLLRDALTRGIDANGELRRPQAEAPHLYKQSPLGWIPNEWVASSVSAEFFVDAGITLGAHRAPRNNPKPYLRVANVHRGRLVLDDIATLEASQSEVSALGLKRGDLLIVEGHASTDEIGRCAMADDSVVGVLFQNHLFRLRPFRLRSEFGLLWLNSSFVRAYWRCEAATSSGLNTINRTKLNRLGVAVPTLAEQEQIIAADLAISSQLASETSMLIKLRRAKSGLMDDLLTGRVRVAPLQAEGDQQDGSI
ncbi:restriction endonuclease subunit S [Burkholderia pseudomallei]|uniref:restriction endonuclease subunit S n=1 Tax=Burkholderia pseudomallei TaxID=28450 RepID=UPI002933E427|nr:restriction endonuclease subunit S [Burkholderia pseudomallei]MDV2119494.1 restriction endonuclease subunit S [Burkholderia pseudomallei]MDV2155188.1 restriction endonuclease subunit S [Burkholderia pseudomallei]